MALLERLPGGWKILYGSYSIPEWSYIVFFAIFGTLMYFIFGCLIGLIIDLLRKRKTKVIATTHIPGM